MIRLPKGKYQIIYADPPWHYRGRKQFGFAGDVGVDTGGAVMHYETMKVEEICAMAAEIQRISDNDCLLYIWIPAPILMDGIRVIKEWGYKYATKAFTWEKRRSNPGYYTLSETEDCYVAKRGRIPQPRGTRNERQFYSELRTEHSRKPLEFRRRITRMHPTQKKIELFATSRVRGWTSWGKGVQRAA